MATDDRPTDDAKPKRRGKAPTITLEAREVVQEPAASAADQPATPDTPGPADSLAAASDPPPEAAADAAAGTVPPDPEALAAIPEPPLPLADEQPPAFAGPADAPREPVSTADPAPPMQSAPAPAPSGGFGRMAAAGLIGALLTAALAVGAQVAGLMPGQNRDQARALEARVADLDRAVREVTQRPVPAPAPSADLAPVNRRLETLDAARSAMEARIATLEQRPAASVAVPPAGATAPAPDGETVTREIEALKLAVEAIAAAQRGLAATASAQAAPQPATPPQPAPAIDMAALDARIRAAGAGQAERVAALETAIAALRRELEAAVTAAKAAETQIAALDASRAQALGLGQGGARILGAFTLREAVERGTPYAPELRAALALGLPAEAARPLAASAERGLPTGAQIAQRFANLAPSLARAAPANPTPGGLLDRIASGAQNLVRVRPIGEAAGDDVPTVVSRVEAKLGRGDLAGALADFDRLPEPARAIGASWAAEARARLAADEALRRLSADAVQSLTGG